MPAPALLTMHRAKGLEFRMVILVGIDDQRLPSRQALGDMPAAERADVTDLEWSCYTSQRPAPVKALFSPGTAVRPRSSLE